MAYFKIFSLVRYCNFFCLYFMGKCLEFLLIEFSSTFVNQESL